jgi:uncharacterized protein (TIGR02646 family)
VRRIRERPSGPEFDAWLKDAARARSKLLEGWADERAKAAAEDRRIKFNPEFNADVYKNLRKIFLYEAFHHKCAYCEVNHSDGYPVHVEHYRPKAEVTQERQPVVHTGYFWLAYEWWNLLLSCANCNTRHTDPQGTSHPGKLNEFPIGGQRVLNPSSDPAIWRAELAGENAVLINPYFDDPTEHLEFDPETGAAVPKTRRGKATIDICDLNRPSLRDKRLAMRGATALGKLIHLVDKDMQDVIPADSELTFWTLCLLEQTVENLRAKVAAERSHKSDDVGQGSG